MGIDSVLHDVVLCLFSRHDSSMILFMALIYGLKTTEKTLLLLGRITSSRMMLCYCFCVCKYFVSSFCHHLGHEKS